MAALLDPYLSVFLKQELGAEAIAQLVWTALFWALGGAITGLLAGYLSYRWFRRIGWYRAVSTTGRWLQGLAVFGSILITGLLFGLMAFAEGIQREIPGLLREGKLGRQTLPRLTGEAADKLFTLDLMLQTHGRMARPEMDTRLDGFRNGRLELPAREFLQRFDTVRDSLVQDLAAHLETRLSERNSRLPPDLRDWLRRNIRRVGAAVGEKKFNAELEALGVAGVYRTLRQNLVQEAARTGNPQTIKRDELALLLVRDGLIPIVHAPIAAYVFQLQAVCLVIALAACLIPAVISRVFRSSSSRTTRR